MKFNWIRRVWYRVNPKHKDRLFCTIFGTEKYKRYALELYNAINGSNYSDLLDLEIITLTDAVYIKMKNDIAYLVSGTIAVYEHQSSVNKNMPVRGFMYYGELYSKILKRQKAGIYNSALVKIPTPQYIVFYNGTKDYPEHSKQRLSEAFINPRDDNDYEFTATVYNINYGMNKDLMDSCEPLRGYSYFVDRVRTNCRSMPNEKAVDEAVKECIENGILRDVFLEERSAVMLEMLTTFDEKVYEEGLREEGREEGREEERANTEREKKRAERAEAALAAYKAKYGEL
ncbi:MAG: hypothetical protein K6F86_06200 [Lachnospiraceae bacterium]|nr:hypothetical protein [Lachnospiraceae bacterium]